MQRRCVVTVVAGSATLPASYTGMKGTTTLLLTDPPYCLLERRRVLGDKRDPKGRKNEGTGRFESVQAYRQFTSDWLPLALRSLHSGPHATACIWTNFLGRQPLIDVAAAQGFTVVAGEFMWVKRPSALIKAPPAAEAAPSVSTSPVLARVTGSEMLLRVVEFALVLRRVPLPPLPVSHPGRTWSVVAGFDDEHTAALYGSHPNHKPFAVLEPLIRGFSAPGEVVVDPFAGSGSIPAAAHKLGMSRNHPTVLKVYWWVHSSAFLCVVLRECVCAGIPFQDDIAMRSSVTPTGPLAHVRG
jgi:site-specific DNA-methyltransferase (adenine-specific)